MLSQGVYSGGGTVYVYTDSWSHQTQIEAPVPAANDNFGRSVSVDGDYAIVGVPGDNAGAAYVFIRSGATNWVQQAKLVASDAASGDKSE